MSARSTKSRFAADISAKPRASSSTVSRPLATSTWPEKPRTASDLMPEISFLGARGSFRNLPRLESPTLRALGTAILTRNLDDRYENPAPVGGMAHRPQLPKRRVLDPCEGLATDLRYVSSPPRNRTCPTARDSFSRER